MIRKFYLLIIATITTLTLTGCNLPQTTHPDELTIIPIGEETISTLVPVVPTDQPGRPLPADAVGPNNFPSDVNPLTGLTVNDPELLDRRPVSIKVTSYPRTSRPQWGLSLADIVYEYYHNNDLTRFNAIFYGNNADQVGPIRSARLFDQYLISSYKTNFASGSADSRIREHLEKQKFGDRLVFLLDWAPCPPRPVCRFEPNGRNYLVGNPEEIGEYLQSLGADDSRPNLDGMVFSETMAEGGTAVSKINIRYSYGDYSFWAYNPETRNYLRYQDTQEDIQGRGEEYETLLDRLNGKEIQSENVIVLLIPHFHFVYKPPSDGNPAVEIVDMKFKGQGKAYAFRDGQAFEIQWIREGKDAMITLVHSDGTPYAFKPGNTWFQVVSKITKLETSDQMWRFVFALNIPEKTINQ